MGQRMPALGNQYFVRIMLSVVQAFDSRIPIGRKVGSLVFLVLIFFPLYVLGSAVPSHTPNVGNAGLDIEIVCNTQNTIDIQVSLGTNISDFSATFFVVLGEDTLGKFQYSELPLTIEDVPFQQGAGAAISLLVEDDPDCNQLIIFPDSEINCQCDISDIKAEILFCETENTARYSIRSFDYFDVANSGFSVQINGQLFTSFFYMESSNGLEITGPMNPSGLNELVIFDNGTDNCMESIELKSIECAFCSIENVEVEANECEDGLFSVTVDFDYENTSDEGFSISVNAIEQGTFTYDELPLTFGSFTGDGEALELSVFDELNNACTSTTSLPVEPCASCGFSNIVVTQSSCEGDSYQLVLDFDTENVGDDGFAVIVNGVPQGLFAYNELPLTFGAFSGSGANTIEIRDLDDGTCSLMQAFETFACTAPVCNITSLVLVEQSCKENYRQYLLNLEYNASVSDSFDVFVHKQSTAYGRFAYANLPVQVDDQDVFVASVNDFELRASDAVSTDCFAALPILVPIDCSPSCVIGNIDIEAQPCQNDGTFDILLSSDFQFDPFGSFYVSINGAENVLYAYNQLPLSLTGNQGNGEIVFQVELIQLDDSDCTNQKVLNPILCPALQCNIQGFELSQGPCQMDGTHSLTIDAVVSNPGANGFTLELNSSEVGTFQYNDLPIEFGSFLGDGYTSFVAIITDNDSNECNASTSLQPAICEEAICSITNLSAVASEECEDGFFEIVVNFLSTGVSEEGFRLSVNSNFIGQFPYNTLPLTLPQGFLGDGVTSIEIEVVDSGNAACSETKVVAPLLCETPTCALSNLDVNILACDISGFYDVEIDFDHENGSAAGFKVLLNQFIIDVFSYDELADGPVTISIDGNLGSSFVLSVGDSDNGIDCALEWPILIDQDCSTGCFLTEDLVLTRTDCDENQSFTVILDVADNILVPAQNDFFTLFVNGSPQQNEQYENLPLFLGPFIGDASTDYQFTIVDILNGDCSASSGSIGIVDCEPAQSPCLIGSEIVSVECNSDNQGFFTMLVEVDVVNQGPNGFEIEINGQSFGIVDASEEFTIGPLLGDGFTEYFVNMFDVDFPNCSLQFTQLPIDCQIEECELTPVVNQLPCSENGLFDAEILLTIQSPASDSFVVQTNTNSTFTFAYDEQEFIIPNLIGDNFTNWSFNFFDSQDASCNNFVELGLVDCAAQSCIIENVQLISDCEVDGSLTIGIDFEYNNIGSQGFSLLVNDAPIDGPAVTTSLLSYANDLPLELNGLDGSAATDYFITIFDNEFPDDCNAEISLVNPEECPVVDQCVIDINNIIVGDCDLNNSVLLEVEYEFQNPSSDKFIVSINGLFDDAYIYDYGDPVILGPFLGDGSVYSISFIDQDNPINCQNTFESEALNCDGGDIPASFTVGDPYPVPMQSSIALADVGLPVDSELTIEVYDTQGRKVGTSLTSLSAGSHTVNIDLSGLLSGMYFLRSSLSGSDFLFVGKVIKGESSP